MKHSLKAEHRVPFPKIQSVRLIKCLRLPSSQRKQGFQWPWLESQCQQSGKSPRGHQSVFLVATESSSYDSMAFCPRRYNQKDCKRFRREFRYLESHICYECSIKSISPKDWKNVQRNQVAPRSELLPVPALLSPKVLISGWKKATFGITLLYSEQCQWFDFTAAGFGETKRQKQVSASETKQHALQPNYLR